MLPFKPRFLGQLEDHLLASMIKLYAPEQIARRSNVVESQLSNSTMDPKRRKDWEGFIGSMAAGKSRPT